MQLSSASHRSFPLPGRGTLAALASVGVLMFGNFPANAGPAPVQMQSEPNLGEIVRSTVAEASRRFGVPERWIVEVMRVESRGVPTAVSPAGAIGLMQVMPATYARLRLRYGLGADPYNPRDSILAGAAYLREMYDHYGAPGFLAAYNAGPGRWEAHLSGARRLPGETLRYLARLGPVVDPSASSLPAFALRTSAPSPLSAPIFVALNIGPRPVAGAAERERIVRVIADNPTIVGRPGAVFVARQLTPESTPDERTVGDLSADQRQPDRPPNGSRAASLEELNPLFALHSRSGERR